MAEYLFSLLILALFSFPIIIFLNIFSIKCHDKSVEIIIDGNENTEELEKLILSAKIVTERHFGNVRVYIRGGSDIEVDTLCKRYGILRK